MTNKFKDNINRFKGRYGQMRLPAIHKWAFDRQGIHAILGVLLGALLPITYLAAPDYLLEIVGILGILTYIFIQYERSENVSINDHAYVDINGYFIGFVPNVAVLAVLMAKDWVLNLF